MSSMAARVERGEDHASGVARSSRAGMKRKVKAGPTRRGWPSRCGRGPRIHMLRNPFFNRSVVIVAVETPFKISMIAFWSIAIVPSWNIFKRCR